MVSRVRQARHQSGRDRVDPYPDDRYGSVGCAGGECHGVGAGNDQVRLATGDLAREIGEALGPSLAGIPLDDQVLSFDITQSAQLFEKRLIKVPEQGVAAGFVYRVDGTGGDDDRDPVLFRLRPYR